jgi:hypothetical protein
MYEIKTYVHTGQTIQKMLNEKFFFRTMGMLLFTGTKFHQYKSTNLPYFFHLADVFREAVTPPPVGLL